MARNTIHSLRRQLKEVSEKIVPRRKYKEIRWVGMDKSLIDESVQDVIWVYTEW
jgi:hypothetical protein